MKETGMKEIHIQSAIGPAVWEREVEIVERKGLGHPDTFCDAVMERVSQALAQAYLSRFGALLHFNCDKGMLVAGRAERRFGGGRLLDPMRLIIGDRAATAWGGEKIDVAVIAVDAAKAWVRGNLPRIDPERHLDYQVELKPGSEALTGLFLKGKRILPANDTSAAVGYAPMSETERLIFSAERHLNSKEFKTRFPETGEDIKIMGVRTGRRLSLTVAVPLVDRYIESEADYFRRKEAVHEALLDYLHGQLHDLQEVGVGINTLDRRGAGMAGMYLSVIGTSAEDADSGEVGRGNQVNGLISLQRPRGSEAAAGKNPASHVGKIYGILAFQMADRIQAEVAGLREATVWLCSRIGEPVDQPALISVQVSLQPHVAIEEVSIPIRRMIQERLERIPSLVEDLIAGRYPVC